MYSIFIDDVCVYDDQNPLKEVKVIDPTLDLEDNTAGSLEMTIFPGSVAYDMDITPMASEVVVKREGTEIWSGRVLNNDEDFYNQRKMYCEGELAYLNDTCQEPQRFVGATVRTFLESVIQLHNNKVGENRRFTVGIVTVTDDLDTVPRETEFQKTLEIINGLVNTLGGHLRVRKVNGVRYLDYLKDYPNIASQEIHFGKNLLEFTRSWDYSELATVLLPVGKTLELEEGREPVDLTDIMQRGTFIHPETGRVVSDSAGTISDGGIDILDGGSDVSSDDGRVTARIEVTEGETYYYSGRISGGYAAYAMFDMFGALDKIEIGPSEGSRDYDETITIPEGISALVVASVDQNGSHPLKLSKAADIDSGPLLDRYVTVKSVTDEHDYYVRSATLMETYGWIEKQVTWDDVEEPIELYHKAMTYLTETQFDGMKIEANAVDLHLIDNSIAPFNLLDQVRIVSEPHGLDKLFPVTGITLPLADPKGVKYVFGNEKNRSLTGINNSINSDIFESLKTIVPADTILKAAKTNATELIRNAALSNGYVTLVKSPEDGSISEILVADSDNYLKAQKVWRWNINGLGFSNNGYNGDYGLAMTMDGQIVADRVTTGTMYADRIRGGTLTLGGANNSFGVLTIQNRVGDSIGAWDKDGLYTSGRIVSYSDSVFGGLDGLDTSHFVVINGSKMYGYSGDIGEYKSLTAANFGDGDDLSGNDLWGSLLLVDDETTYLPNVSKVTTLRGTGAILLYSENGVCLRAGNQAVLINRWTVDQDGRVTLFGRNDWML